MEAYRRRRRSTQLGCATTQAAQRQRRPTAGRYPPALHGLRSAVGPRSRTAAPATCDSVAAALLGVVMHEVLLRDDAQ